MFKKEQPEFCKSPQFGILSIKKRALSNERMAENSN